MDTLHCKTCSFWTRVTDPTDLETDGPHAGTCSCPKFINASQTYGPVPIDGVNLWDFEGFGVTFVTGESFGCIHWSPKP